MGDSLASTKIMAYALLRVALGVNLAGHGFVRISNGVRFSGESRRGRGSPFRRQSIINTGFGIGRPIRHMFNVYLPAASQLAFL